MQDVLAFSAPFTKQSIQAFIWLWTQAAIFMSPGYWEPQYDYVIVGGGVAGSVLANRLSEDPRVSVLLIEAGSYENMITDIPYLSPTLQQTALDWKFKTVPQERSCLQLINRVITEAESNCCIELYSVCFSKAFGRKARRLVAHP